MNDQPRDDMPALLRAHTPRAGPAGPDCLDEETIAAVVDGVLDQELHRATIDHLASCARCRAAVAAVSRLVADNAVAAAARTVRSPRRWQVPVGLAAAAALVLVLVWPKGVNDDLVHRDPTIAAASAPALVAPVGTVADAGLLKWTSVPGSNRYRVTVFDGQGRVVYETQVADTAVLLPDSIAIVRGQSYLWQVSARTGWDRWAASELVEFRVAGARP